MQSISFFLQKQSRLALAVIALAAITITLQSCNIWSVFGGCSGDEQCLSEARACFDRGDLDCAEEAYNELSSAYSDEKTSGLVYINLERAQAGMGEIMAGLGTEGGSIGTIFTTIANRIGKDDPDTDRRELIYDAFRLATDETFDDVNQQNFLKLISSMALFSHLLSEYAVEAGGDADDLRKTHFCSSFAGTCAGATATATASAAASFDLTVAGTANGRMDDVPVDFGQMDAAFDAFQNAANALNLGGGFGEALDQAAGLGASDPTTAATWASFITESTFLGIGAE